MDPRNLNVFTADTVFKYEVKCHLHSFEHVQLQIVLNAGASCSASCLYVDPSVSCMRLTKVVLSANFGSLIDGFVEVHTIM